MGQGEGQNVIAEKLEKQALRKEETARKQRGKSKYHGNIIPYQPISTQ